MPRIIDCADRAVVAHHWHSEEIPLPLTLGRARKVYHYTTRMLTFVLDAEGEWNGDVNTVITSIGHGTRSDQNGMNQLFARLSMPFVYRRDGRWARIDRLNRPLFRYGITDMTRLARFERRVGVQHVVDNWTTRFVTFNDDPLETLPSLTFAGSTYTEEHP